MILCMSLTQHFVEILAGSFLKDAMSYRCLYDSSCGGPWQVLVSRFCKSSSRSFDDDLVKFSWGSGHDDLAQGLLQFLVWRSCGEPSEMLSEAFA